MIFNSVARSFNLTVSNLSYGRIKDISDDFSIKNYSYQDSLTNLNDWISYYYLYGKFPGSEEFINVPFVNKSGFLKTETNLSPADLYSKFSATTTKGLVSLHVLCALNIYLGRSKTVSQFAYEEFMKNLTYQALSQENDDIFLSFDFATDLAHSIVNALADIENEEGKMASETSDQISDKFDTEFKTVESAAMQIQQGEEPEISQEPIQASTPLMEKDIRKIHDKEKTDYLKIAIKLNTVNLESAAEVADSENEKFFQEIINPTTGLTLDDEIDIDKQFSFRNNSDLGYSLPEPLKSRLDDILHNAKEKINSVKFSPKVIEEIPNNTYPSSEITTDDFYIGYSFPDLQNLLYFPQPSTDDRNDFSINIPENKMILFKSPSLTLACVNKKELQNILNKIIEDLYLNLTENLMSTRDEQETKQKILILKKF